MSLHAKRKATDFIVIHCTATVEGKEYRVKDIDKMHRARGFNGIGYHFLICLDGTIEAGRPVDTIGAHVEGFNANSVSMSYVGGVDAKGKAKDTRTAAQKRAMELLTRQLLGLYPNAVVKGHRDFSPDKNRNGRVDPHERIKECPCFDAIDWWKSVNVAANHTVEAGDTLYAIARKFNVTVDKLVKDSGINPNAPLKIGQVLTIR